MAISYIPLEIMLIKRKIPRTRLEQDGVITRSTIAKFRRGEYVSLAVIDKLCGYFDCRIEDIVEYVRDE